MTMITTNKINVTYALEDALVHMFILESVIVRQLLVIIRTNVFTRMIAIRRK